MDECTPLVRGIAAGLAHLHGAGLHSSTSQLNLSRVCHKENTLHTLIPPATSLNTGYTTPTRNPYPIQSAQDELKSGRV